jgi:hypothetical protein
MVNLVVLSGRHHMTRMRIVGSNCHGWWLVGNEELAGKRSNVFIRTIQADKILMKRAHVLGHLLGGVPRGIHTHHDDLCLVARRRFLQLPVELAEFREGQWADVRA